MKIAKLNGRPEIFYSIQGEGKNSGQPNIFVRSSLCNLKCVWCDTPYTWDWEKYKKEDEIMEMTPEEIVKEVLLHPCKNLVFTGGEPMLQQEGWIEIMERLRKIDGSFWFEVETNGTLKPKLKFDALIHQYNVSPKLKNSGNPTDIGLAQNPKAIFKFVVQEKKDIDEILALFIKYPVPYERVYLMPEGKTVQALDEKGVWLKAACQKHGFHYTDRLHIRRWGAQRGI